MKFNFSISNHLSYKTIEIDEEMLREMCAFSSMSATSNQKKEGGFQPSTRPPPKDNDGKMSQTKAVVEDIDITLDGDEGTGGRPRFKEEVKLPPQYE
jgi:hypothetical protein